MIITVNKPKGPSSFAMVARARKIYNEKKVGHAGTLDPLASGVLVLAIGREDTKKIAEIVGKEKEYLAEITLGETSTTDDGEGEITIISISAILILESFSQLVFLILDFFMLNPYSDGGLISP